MYQRWAWCCCYWPLALIPGWVGGAGGLCLPFLQNVFFPVVVALREPVQNDGMTLVFDRQWWNWKDL